MTSASSAWSCGLSTNENALSSTIAEPQPEDVVAGEDEQRDRRGTGEVDADDDRPPADPVRQPPGDERPRDGRHQQHGVHRPDRRRVEADDLVEVERHEDVEHAQPARAAAEDRGGEQPAQVAVGEDAPVDRADRPVGSGGLGRGVLPDEREDGDRDDERGDAQHRDGGPPANGGDRQGSASRPRRRCRRCRPRRGPRSPSRSGAAGTARRAARCRPGAGARRRCARRRSRRRTRRTRP